MSRFFETFSTSGRPGSALDRKPVPKNPANVSLFARNHASVHCTMRWALSSVTPSGGLHLSRFFR